MVKKFVLFAFLLFLFPFSFSFQKPDYIKETYMVEMRDGIKLATDIYLAGEGKYPVVLIRTPYNKNSTDESLIKAFLSRGYALVIQDLRGCHASEAKFRAFLDDGWGATQDGNDTVKWIREQEWCNGKVAVWGGSAMGIAAYLLAGSCDVNCILSAIAASNLYKHAMYPGGEWRGDAEIWLEEQRAEYMMPVFEEHYTYGDFWHQIDLSTRYPQISTPIFHIGGWYDIFAEGTIDAFQGLKYKGNQKLLMGPWTHAAFVTRQQGDLLYPVNSFLDVYGVTFSWLDYWMKGKDTGVMDEKVRFYMMGECDTVYGYRGDGTGNEWWISDDWPPYTARATPFYFHENGLLNQEKPRDEDFDSYIYNPSDPFPTTGGRNLVFPAGPLKQNEVEARKDVISYTSPPFEEPLYIAGNITAHLWVSSSARDTDFCIRICDLYPDGSSFLVLDSIFMARHRISFEREDFLEAGKIYEINISVGNVAIVFNKGHRIRVDITSSNYPAYERNPNTGDAIHKNKSYVIVENTIWHDEQHPSCIILPILEKFEIEPIKGVYVAGKKIMDARMLAIIGKMDFEVDANCSKVSLYLDNRLVYEDTSKPFILEFDETAIGFHKLKFAMFDDEGMIVREKTAIILNL